MRFNANGHPSLFFARIYLQVALWGWFCRWKDALVISLGGHEGPGQPFPLVGWWRLVYQQKTDRTNLQNDSAACPYQMLDIEHQGKQNSPRSLYSIFQ